MSTIFINSYQFGVAGFAYDAIPDLVHVYEIARRTLTSYTGPLVRLRRASDSAQSDFGPLANGDLDVASIATWAGGDSFIHTIYDQVGSDNVTQATDGNQPLFVASGQGGRAVGRYVGAIGASSNLRVVFASAITLPISIYAAAVSDVANDSANRWIFSDTSTALGSSKYGPATPDVWSMYAGAFLLGGTANVNWNIFSYLYNGASSQFWTNGSSQASGNTGANTTMNGIVIGNVGGLNSAWDGDIAAVIVADPNHDTTNRQAVEAAINSYYAIY